MYRFNKLMVAVDFSATDHSVLAYASHIARLAHSARVYFIHVASSLELPDEIREQYPQLIEPLDEYAVKRMNELASKFFSDQSGVELAFEVGEGEPVGNILRMIRMKDVDLVLVGQAGSPPYDYSLGEKLARKAPCSVLIIPDGAQPFYRNISVACDFSDNSLDAMDVARAFTRAAELNSFSCVHVYDVPSGYYKTGKSYEAFAEVMKNNATHQFIAMMKQMDMKDINPDLELILDKNPARAIDRYINAEHSDLLIVGTRGRAPGAGILLGSVTEKLIRSIGIPLLAVKKKGSGLDLLDAILKR